MRELNHLILNLYGTAQECTSGEFQGQALDMLRQALPFDSAAIIAASFSPDMAISLHSLHMYQQPIEKLADRKALVSPDAILAEACRSRGRCVTMESVDIDRRYLDLHAYCRKYAIAHSMVLISPATHHANLDLIALWRAGPERGYSAAETELGNLLLPHLTQAQAINSRLFRAPEVQPPPGSVRLLASLNGCLQYVEPIAADMLQREWPEWEPPMLPAGLVEELRRPGLGRYVGKTLVAQVAESGGYLHIQLAQRPAGRPLTGGEAAVARLAASGLSYKDIARRHGVSPATVRNQLHSVYAKLDVGNKTALAAALAVLTEMLP
ncbi:MAG: helix-turn-helix transcriptional regulator [Janthinobacterium sp.]